MADFTYKKYEGFPSEAVLEQLTIINQEIFDFGETSEHLSMALRERQKILICLAFHESRIIGFKVGFQERPQYFESWRGGVNGPCPCAAVVAPISAIVGNRSPMAACTASCAACCW